MMAMLDSVRRDSRVTYQTAMIQDSECVLSYPGVEEDKRIAEKIFVECSNSCPTSSLFHQKVAAMKVKQRLFEGDRSHPDVVALDSKNFTYDGWDSDREEAMRRITGDCSILFMGGFQDKFRGEFIFV
jgi:4-hydroxy-3-methylbut-2-enyl diphosphate reductase IspH